MSAARRAWSWQLVLPRSVATVWGRRERVRRGGYPSRTAAAAARDELLGRSPEECTTQAWTVGRWLRYWLATRTSIRPSTLRAYTQHVEGHLIPHLGRVRLAELTNRQVTTLFAALATADTRYGRRPTPATLHRIRATLRAALNAAIRDGLLADNPARRVELPSPRRPHPQVWTAQRVRAWHQRRQRFAVAVWTAQQLATFLNFVAADRLAATWWLIALRGLRRGEAAGLRWIDVDLDQRLLTIDQQRIVTVVVADSARNGASGCRGRSSRIAPAYQRSRPLPSRLAGQDPLDLITTRRRRSSTTPPGH